MKISFNDLACGDRVYALVYNQVRKTVDISTVVISEMPTISFCGKAGEDGEPLPGQDIDRNYQLDIDFEVDSTNGHIGQGFSVRGERINLDFDWDSSSQNENCLVYLCTSIEALVNAENHIRRDQQEVDSYTDAEDQDDEEYFDEVEKVCDYVL